MVSRCVLKKSSQVKMPIIFSGSWFKHWILFTEIQEVVLQEYMYTLKILIHAQNIWYITHLLRYLICLRNFMNCITKIGRYLRITHYKKIYVQSLNSVNTLCLSIGFVHENFGCGLFIQCLKIRPAALHYLQRYAQDDSMAS